MVEDLNFHKVKKLFFVIISVLFFSTNLFAQNLKFKKLVVLNDPWGSSFLNNKQLIITEKGGKIKIIDIRQKKAVEIDHNLNFLEHGQGGLLDILYKDNFIYVSYSENRGNGKTSTSIAKAIFDKKKLNFKNIFQAEPPIDSGYHFGSRLALSLIHI